MKIRHMLAFACAAYAVTGGATIAFAHYAQAHPAQLPALAHGAIIICCLCAAISVATAVNVLRPRRRDRVR